MYKLLLYLALTMICSGVYVLAGLQVPRDWKKIHRGSAREEVRAVCENLNEGMHDIKGDFCSAGLPLMTWSLQILYAPDETVQNAHLVLILGTKDTHKRIYSRDLAEAPNH